ncbi:MAG: VIT domain-containing protein [Hyphomicrobium sp.]
MPSISTRPANDPVSQVVLRSAQSAGRYPVPLTKTAYAISISGGLADVTARRTFHNGETLSLESTLTFPLPVHAVLYALEARIGDRVVKAVAKSRKTARETYEHALDRGKSTVLHEELMRGVHMLSVGHIAPGTEIEVTACFALALSWIGGRALLRIPMTVGDVYGHSGLSDSDEMVHGGTVLAGDLEVTCDCGTPVLLGGTLNGGKARVWLDAPVNIEVQGWRPRDLEGRSADGRLVTLGIAPAATETAHLDCAILVDHSGSMAEPCTGAQCLSKHAAVMLGLSEAADDLGESDRLNLWEFDMSARDLGTAHASTWRSLIRNLAGPEGGTEIGRSLATLLAERPVKDVLLITDGKSHALDVQSLAGRGVRFTVVLIGEDSLEANVGHLAAVTGGEIFVPEGADVSAAVRAALRSLRSPSLPNASEAGRAVARVRRAGMAVTAEWSAGEPLAEVAAGRPVAAFAASLRFASLPEADASKLAEAEGLVTHLTSLVLVVEEGASQNVLPVTRKVALPTPAAASMPMLALGGGRSFGVASRAAYCHRLMPSAVLRSDSGRVRLESFLDDAPSAPAPKPVANAPSPSRPSILRLEEQSNALADRIVRTRRGHTGVPGYDDLPDPIADLSSFPALIDWKSEASRLGQGNMLGLDPTIADAIDDASRHRLVRRAAKRVGISPRLFVIGLLARAVAAHDRFADRVARAILGRVKPAEIAQVVARLCLGKAARMTA